MKKTLAATILFGCLTALPATGQFLSSGSDAPGLKWRSITTASWKVIYPAGADSLAREYARCLESWRSSVGSSIGIVPNESFRRQMPVVLHTENAVSNGMVGWAPKRMELFTTPESTDPDPIPWMQLLSIHESRHVSQMQYPAGYPWRWLRIATGELWTVAAQALYPELPFLEGDAVVAETGLSISGRARTADFLEYIRACNLEGKHRSWWQWRYGSLGRFAPDYYKAGYMLVAGMRSVYDEPLFTQKFYERMQKKVFPEMVFSKNNLCRTVEKVSDKTLRSTWKTIDANITGIWEEESSSRAPYTVSKPVGEPQRLYVSYSNLTPSPPGVWAVRAGIGESSSLVLLERISSGGKDEGPEFRERRIGAFSNSAGRLCWSEPAGRLYWSEIIPDPRWEQRSFSAIRYVGPDGRKKDLVRGRRLFNPSASSLRKELAAVEYPGDGSSRVVIIDAESGKDIRSIPVPAGLQVSETVWAGEDIYAAVLSAEGFSLRILPGFAPVLKDIPVKMNNLSFDGKRIIFTSDRGASNEAYAYSPEDKTLVQLTSSRVGSRGGVFTDGGLLFTSVSSAGRAVFFAPAEALRTAPVEWSERHSWVWEDKLSQQEKDLQLKEAAAPPPEEIPVSEPRPYRKLTHLFRVHSWLPVYVNPDDVADASLETVYQNVRVGGTVFFQNTLGTMYGTAGAKFFQNTDSAPWAGGSVRLTYCGLYPVFDAAVDIGDRFASRTWIKEQDGSFSRASAPTGIPSVVTTLRTYVPMDLSSGGWRRGAIASLSWSFSNDLNGSTVVSGEPASSGDIRSDFTDPRYSSITGIKAGQIGPSSAATAALRAYAYLPIPSSCVFPRFGAGVEAGCRFFTGVGAASSPIPYIYSYGYLPGILREQGIRLSFGAERQDPSSLLKRNTLNLLPRGLSDVEEVSPLMATYPCRSRLTADYVIPFASLEWDRWCPWLYFRNLEATVHGDYAYIWGGTSPGRSLASAGADFCVVFANLMWIPYETRFGLGWNHNWGGFDKNTFNFIFSIAL